MSKLKYEIGNFAGPFTIVDLDRNDQEWPYRVEWHGHKEWLTSETTESLFDNYTKSKSLETKHELLEKKAESQRKAIDYWKKKSNDWEQKYFVFQENVNTEIEAIGADLDSALSSLKEAKTQLKWAHEGNQELLERCKNAEALELASKAEIKVKNVEISLLKSDFETKSSELEIIEEDYNQFKADSLHTRTLAWVGWIMFFISIFGMIFLRN
jgi:hypothetical protein